MMRTDCTDTAPAALDLNRLHSDVGDLCHILETADDIVFELARVGNPEHDAALDRVETLVRFARKQARQIDQQIEASFGILGRTEQ